MVFGICRPSLRYFLTINKQLDNNSAFSKSK